MSQSIYNHYRERKIGDSHLITNDAGNWCILDKTKFDMFRFGKLENDLELKNLLRKKGFLIDNANLQEITDLTKTKFNYLFKGTSLHIVVPTLRCNHRCVYCHSNVVAQHKKGYDMDMETAKKTVDFIFQSPSDTITIEFQGGEPLLNYDIIEYIIEYAKETNKKHKKLLGFDLVTNLSKMDDTILKYLIKNKVGLCTSLDGPEKLHNKNRIYMGGNSYKDVVYWIKEINEDYNYNINALMVTTRDSLPYYKEIIDEYVNNNLNWIKLRFLSNLGFASKTADKINYSPKEYLDFWTKSMDYLVKINKNHPIRDRMVEYILAKLKGVWCNYTDFQSPCGAVIGQLAYVQNGNIHTCDEGRQYEMFRLGNVFDNTYKEILTSNQSCSMIASSVNDTLLCDACAYKPFCGVCPVCNYADSGSLVSILPRDQRCLIYKGMFDYIFTKLNSVGPHKKLFDNWMENLTVISQPGREDKTASL